MLPSCFLLQNHVKPAPGQSRSSEKRLSHYPQTEALPVNVNKASKFKPFNFRHASSHKHNFKTTHRNPIRHSIVALTYSDSAKHLQSSQPNLDTFDAISASEAARLQSQTRKGPIFQTSMHGRSITDNLTSSNAESTLQHRMIRPPITKIGSLALKAP